MTEVHKLFSEAQLGPTAETVGVDFVQVARAVAAICATRALLMVAILTGSGIWSFTIWQPTTDRIAAAIAFSVVFVTPLVALYWRRA